MQADTESILKSCIAFLRTSAGEVMPSSLGTAVRGSRLQEVIHLYFCYILLAENSIYYVLILKDDVDSYKWLTATAEADAETTADAPLHWFALFGGARIWVSNRRSHFKNDLRTKLRETFKSEHYFRLPYCVLRSAHGAMVLSRFCAGSCLVR